MDHIIYDGGENDLSIARGAWRADPKEKFDPTILIRWNGDDDDELGTPVSRSHPYWLVLPAWIHEAILDATAKKIAQSIEDERSTEQ